MSSMPENVRLVYEPLWQKLSDIHFKWMIYRQLFGTNPDRIDLLNEFAPVLFGVVQSSMLDSTFLAISRLTDPLKSAGKDNLVLRRLEKVVDEDEAGLSLRLNLLQKLQDIESQCNVFRVIRNKKLAHNDLETHQATQAEDTEPMKASRQQVEEALRAIRDFMNAIEGHYLGSETLYGRVIVGTGDGESLIHHLSELKLGRLGNEPYRTRVGDASRQD